MMEEITSCDDEFIDSYMQYMKDISLLSFPPTNEKDLNGSIDSRNMLVEKNLRLVLYVIKSIKERFSTVNKNDLDLIQEGNLALIDASEHFDESLGYTFSSYAVPTIYNRLICYISSSNRTISVPIAVLLAQYKFYDATGERYITEEYYDVALSLGISDSMIKRINQIPIEVELETQTLLSIPCKEEYIESIENELYFASSVNYLLSNMIMSEQNKEIIREYLSHKESSNILIKSLSEKYHVSSTRISQIIQKFYLALQKKYCSDFDISSQKKNEEQKELDKLLSRRFCIY